MTPYERLMAEEIPTRPDKPEPQSPWTPEQQAQHRADLLEALDADRRHLQLVRQATAA
jgi:hypothetical protein